MHIAAAPYHSAIAGVRMSWDAAGTESASVRELFPLEILLHIPLIVTHKYSDAAPSLSFDKPSDARTGWDV